MMVIRHGWKSIGFGAAMLMVFSAVAAAVDVPVSNGSFEDVNTLPVGGIWPEVDADPLNADFWLEPGPIGTDLNAFPPELIPPGFSLPAGVTSDTGVFFNAPFGQDPATGNFFPNPSFVADADGDQLAYLFAKDDLDPGVGFYQALPAVLESGLDYTLTVAVGKSFFLPPIGGDRSDPVLGLRLIYEDGAGQHQAITQTEVAASEVSSMMLVDFSTTTSPIPLGHSGLGQPIGIAIAPIDGDSGVWIFDNVRLTAVPEPASVLTLGALGLGWGRGRRRFQSRNIQ